MRKTRATRQMFDIQKVSDLKVMNSGKVRSPAGPWRRGGGNGHPQGEGGKHHKQFIPVRMERGSELCGSLSGKVE